MPTYPYTCINCEKNYEVVRSIHAKEDIPICTDCGYATIRVYEATAVTFKGGGFYKTENRKK